ncbi:MAG: hypothetical protein WCA85_30145 [Paraburkholderia sp.]|uniref:hypothetical protein n=1 Tax=Paraburkholderia sp. TaxID=1926495 RepID=UPI003C685330
MRLVFRIALHHLPMCAALCGALALVALPQSANAQASGDSNSVSTQHSVAVTSPANDAFATVTATPKAQDAASTANPGASGSDLADVARSVPTDATSPNDFSLDDQVLSRQRGGFSGMLMVAATPQLMRSAGNGGNGVTLWDEIAPPSPMPIPLDAAANAQGNVAAYQRK